MVSCVRSLDSFFIESLELDFVFLELYQVFVRVSEYGRVIGEACGARASN